MKKYLLFIFLFTAIYSYSQVSFGPKHNGKPGKFKDGQLKNFKNSTTIFVFSDVLEKKVYDDILQETWSVTPYKIVSHKDFNPLDYDEGNYSFAQVSGFKRVKTTGMGSTVVSLYTYFDILMYDFKSIHKKIEKLSPKKIENKFSDILMENELSIARFYLFPNSDFVNTAIGEKMEDIVDSMFNEVVFLNYQPGMLKNYFQKVNQLIKTEEVYWMYEENGYTEEITKLEQQKLFIPNYLGVKTNAFTAAQLEGEEQEIIALYDTYEYLYQFISYEALNKRILEGEEFYYLRYVRINAEKFLEVVNSKTGDITYRNYIPGLGYNVKAKHLKELNKTISKAIKKSL